MQVKSEDKVNSCYRQKMIQKKKEKKHHPSPRHQCNTQQQKLPELHIGKRIRILQIVKNATRNTTCIDRSRLFQTRQEKKKKNPSLLPLHVQYQSFKQKQEGTRQSNSNRKTTNSGKTTRKKRRRRTKLVARGEGRKREKEVVNLTLRRRRRQRRRRRGRSGAMATYTRTKLSKRKPNGKTNKKMARESFRPCSSYQLLVTSLQLLITYHVATRWVVAFNNK